MTAAELVRKIYEITQGTPVYKEQADLTAANAEAERLDKAIQSIDYLCDVYISENRKHGQP